MPLNFVNRKQLTSTEAVGVNTGYLATSKQNALVTDGAAYCIIIVLHDDAAGGAMAHIPPGTDEAPALAKMVAYLSERGAQASSLQVLLGGAASREKDPNWRAGFIGKLQQAGLREANVLDARVPVGGKTAIGTSVGEARGVLYEPSTGQLSDTLYPDPVTPKGKASGVKVYKIADPGGAVSASGSDGACVLL